jgi:hypothetical protein
MVMIFFVNYEQKNFDKKVLDSLNCQINNEKNIFLYSTVKTKKRDFAKLDHFIMNKKINGY